MRTFTISLDEVFPLIDEQRRLYEELGFKICPEDGGVDTSLDCYPLKLEMESLNPLIDKMVACGINRNHGVSIHGDKVTLYYRELD